MVENYTLEGEWIFYRQSGQLWQIGNFQNNKKHGKWIRFNKDNQVEIGLNQFYYN